MFRCFNSHKFQKTFDIQVKVLHQVVEVLPPAVTFYSIEEALPWCFRNPADVLVGILSNETSFVSCTPMSRSSTDNKDYLVGEIMIRSTKHIYFCDNGLLPHASRRPDDDSGRRVNAMSVEIKAQDRPFEIVAPETQTQNVHSQNVHCEHHHCTF
jgi:hypothetical protein